MTNNTPITIPAGAPGVTSGDASVYPSTITASGLGPITDVNVTITGLTHTHPDDLDILLVSPSGTGVVLMSDAGGATDIGDYQYTFDDEATNAMSDGSLNTGFFYKPTAFDAGDTWTGYVGTPSSTLSAFDGRNPNGVWSLRIVDDGGSDVGESETWSLKITTADNAALIVPGNTTASSGPASAYPLNLPVSGKPGKIKDVNIKLTGVFHTDPDDLDILLVAPTGQGVLIMSDSCGSSDVVDYQWTFDDEAAATMTDSTLTGCNPFVVRPSNYGSSDDFPAPAPTGPYQTVLSSLDGLAANGTWKLFVMDDAGGDGGFIKSVALQFVMTPPNTIVTARPKAKTTSRKATIRFKSSLPGSTFTCKVDKKPVKACNSPLKLTRLKVGKHTVLIRAKTAAGGADPTPAKVTWTVKR